MIDLDTWPTGTPSALGACSRGSSALSGGPAGSRQVVDDDY